MNLSPRTRLNETESSAQRDLRCQCAPTRTRHRRRNDRASDVFAIYTPITQSIVRIVMRLISWYTHSEDALNRY